MTDIIPAVMPKSVRDIEDTAEAVAGLVDTLQVDIVDGLFSERKTWPYVRESGREEFALLVREESTLPLWEKLTYEIDLMVQEPESVVDAWIMAGAGRLIIHVESTNSLEELLKNLETRMKKSADDLFGVEVGLALSLETPLSAVTPFIPQISFVQCMGIAHIGRQGEPFDERVVTRVRQLREMYPDLILSVDGGVNLENASRLVDAGANRLVSGSALLQSDNIRETLAEFRHSI